MRWDVPPFRINQEIARIVVDVQSFGEYPTTIHEIRLVDLSNEAIVWHLLADSGTPQIHRVTLSVGPNAAQIRTPAGSYRVIVPADAAQFLLTKGKPYRIEVWGTPSKFSRRSAEFVFAQSS